MTEKISAFVITAGKRDSLILRATLSAVRWVDELILVDKSDGIPGDMPQAWVGHEFGAKYYMAEPSPVVEPTREYADSLCSHDWRICLDDDEILSPATEEWARGAVEIAEAKVWDIPMHDYILGRWDPAIRSEYRPTLYRKGIVKYGPTVHGGRYAVGDRCRLPFDGDVYIDHLSHATAHDWIEKTQRYTDQKDRAWIPVNDPLMTHAEKRLAEYKAFAGDDPYRQAFGLLRLSYDIADALKRWEESEPDGEAEFRRIAKTVLARGR